MLKQILKNESYLSKVLFTGFQYTNKLRFFYETMNNPFLNKNEFAQTYYRVIQVYSGFRKFVQIYKFQKAKLVVTTDLCLSELNPANTQVMCIQQYNNRYLFHINDLLHIIEHSLSSSHLLFSIPQMIKNPYTNLPFNKSTLYNIYLFKRCKKCELLDLFFQSNFNIKLFAKTNEHILREYAIKEYVYKSEHHVIRDEIMEMIDSLNTRFGQPITIHPEFPTKTLIPILRPYLMLWFTCLSSLIAPKKTIALQTLYTKWGVFIKHNPQFGRKIVRSESKFVEFKRITIQVVEFNCDAPRFVTNSTTAKFMKNHLF